MSAHDRLVMRPRAIVRPSRAPAARGANPYAVCAPGAARAGAPTGGFFGDVLGLASTEAVEKVEGKTWDLAWRSDAIELKTKECSESIERLHVELKEQSDEILSMQKAIQEYVAKNTRKMEDRKSVV